MVAALAVLLFHARIYLGVDFGPLNGLVGSMDLAVFAFFSLSGFLVFRPFAAGDVAVRTHLVKRLVRVFPAYLVAIAAALWLTGAAATRGHELEFALILQGLNPSIALQVMPVAWSLHVEVVFYLVLPLVVAATAVLGGQSHRRRAAVLVGLGLLSLGARVAVTAPDGISEYVVERYAPMMLWAFLPGMLVAYGLARSPRVARSLADPSTCLLGMCLVSVALAVIPDDRAMVELARMFMVAVGSALMIPWLVALGIPGRLARVVADGGRCLSYPIYLWHATVMFVLVAFGIHGWPGLAVALLMVLLLSVGSWLFVERPSLRGARAIVSRMRSTDQDLSGPCRGGGSTGRHVILAAPCGKPPGRRRRVTDGARHASDPDAEVSDVPLDASLLDRGRPRFPRGQGRSASGKHRPHAAAKERQVPAEVARQPRPKRKRLCPAIRSRHVAGTSRTVRPARAALTVSSRASSKPPSLSMLTVSRYLRL